MSIASAPMFCVGVAFGSYHTHNITGGRSLLRVEGHITMSLAFNFMTFAHDAGANFSIA